MDTKIDGSVSTPASVGVDTTELKNALVKTLAGTLHAELGSSSDVTARVNLNVDGVRITAEVRDVVCGDGAIRLASLQCFRRFYIAETVGFETWVMRQIEYTSPAYDESGTETPPLIGVHPH